MEGRSAAMHGHSTSLVHELRAFREVLSELAWKEVAPILMRYISEYAPQAAANHFDRISNELQRLMDSLAHQDPMKQNDDRRLVVLQKQRFESERAVEQQQMVIELHLVLYREMLLGMLNMEHPERDTLLAQLDRNRTIQSVFEKYSGISSVIITAQQQAEIPGNRGASLLLSGLSSANINPLVGGRVISVADVCPPAGSVSSTTSAYAAQLQQQISALESPPPLHVNDLITSPYMPQYLLYLQQQQQQQQQQITGNQFSSTSPSKAHSYAQQLYQTIIPSSNTPYNSGMHWQQQQPYQPASDQQYSSTSHHTQAAHSSYASWPLNSQQLQQYCPPGATVAPEKCWIGGFSSESGLLRSLAAQTIPVVHCSGVAEPVSLGNVTLKTSGSSKQPRNRAKEKSSQSNEDKLRAKSQSCHSSLQNLKPEAVAPAAVASRSNSIAASNCSSSDIMSATTAAISSAAAASINGGGLPKTSGRHRSNSNKINGSSSSQQRNTNNAGNSSTGASSSGGGGGNSMRMPFHFAANGSNSTADKSPAPGMVVEVRPSANVDLQLLQNSWHLDNVRGSLFVTGAMANKALGFGNARGRIYKKHEEIMRYRTDFDDHRWLVKEHHVQANVVPGRVFLMRLADVELLLPQYEEQNDPRALEPFRIPDWMMQKVLTFAAQQIEEFRRAYGGVLFSGLSTIEYTANAPALATATNGGGLILGRSYSFNVGSSGGEKKTKPKSSRAAGTKNNKINGAITDQSENEAATDGAKKKRKQSAKSASRTSANGYDTDGGGGKPKQARARKPKAGYGGGTTSMRSSKREIMVPGYENDYVYGNNTTAAPAVVGSLYANDDDRLSHVGGCLSGCGCIDFLADDDAVYQQHDAAKCDALLDQQLVADADEEEAEGDDEIERGFDRTSESKADDVLRIDEDLVSSSTNNNGNAEAKKVAAAVDAGATVQEPKEAQCAAHLTEHAIITSAETKIDAELPSGVTDAAVGLADKRALMPPIACDDAVSTKSKPFDVESLVDVSGQNLKEFAEYTKPEYTKLDDDFADELKRDVADDTLDITVTRREEPDDDDVNMNGNSGGGSGDGVDSEEASTSSINSTARMSPSGRRSMDVERVNEN